MAEPLLLLSSRGRGAGEGHVGLWLGRGLAGGLALSRREMLRVALSGARNARLHGRVGKHLWSIGVVCSA